MSKMYAYSNTQAGIARRQQERGQPIAAIEAVEARTVLVKPPVAMESPAQPVIGLCVRTVRTAVVVEFIPSTASQKIIADVAHQHQITYADVISKSRRRQIVKARTEAIWALKDWNPSLSLLQIGRIIGGRDHTTILHALRKRGAA